MKFFFKIITQQILIEKEDPGIKLHLLSPVFSCLLMQQLLAELFPFPAITVHQDYKLGYDRVLALQEFMSKRDLEYINT